MSIKMKHLICAILCLVTGQEVSSEEKRRLYLGAETQWRKMGYTESANEIFKNTFPSMHAFGGFKFNEYVGIEGGITLSKNKNTRSGATFSGSHLGVMTFLPMTEKVQFIASAGITHVRSVFKMQDGLFRFRISRSAPRFMGGAQYFLTDRVGLRGSMAWERTKKLVSKQYKIAPKNTTLYNLGLIVLF